MGRHVFFSVLAFSAIALVLALLASAYYGNRPNIGFPWQIEVLPDGSTRVFQVHLGSTTLEQMEQLFEESAETTLFDPKDEPPVVEAYFNDLFIGGLKAKMVASFNLSEAQTQAIYDRGVRISTLGSGTRKVTLAAEDLQFIKQQPVYALTYLPSINLEAELLEKRFGEPAQKITDTASGGVHWLYPQLGVDVVLSDDAKEVVQYVRPKDFSTLQQPLSAAPAPAATASE